METYQYQLLPALTTEEYEALRADIAERGVMVPVEYDEAGNILDGHHRVQACIELGLADWPRVVRQGWTEEQKIEHVLALNLDRRHLSGEQRRGVALDLRSKGLSLRRIGAMLRVDEKTVRNDLAGAEFSAPATVTGSDGKQYPAQRIERPANPQLSWPEPEREPETHRREPADEWDWQQQIAPEPEPAPTPSPFAALHFSSEEIECYTPPAIVARVIDALGEIDLDPCSNSHTKPNVPAREHITAQEDGLRHAWHGRIFMNPPYGRELVEWTRKARQEYEAGRVTEAILLVPSRTDTEWFRELRDYPRCFIYGRLRFVGQENSAPFPSMAVYLGPRMDAFRLAFAEIGDVYRLA